MNLIGFTPCDICGIGLGKYKNQRTSGHMVRKWHTIEGERAYKWKWGEITQRYLVFQDIEYPGGYITELVPYEKKIVPKRVCFECLEKYLPPDKLKATLRI
jgi:hypothetical protein